jgi:hypothetical protein
MKVSQRKMPLYFLKDSALNFCDPYGEYQPPRLINLFYEGRYGIERGGADLFSINPRTGVVFTKVICLLSKVTKVISLLY